MNTSLGVKPTLSSESSQGPLTPAQLRELNNVSLGVSSKEAASTQDMRINTIDRHRHELSRRLGACTMAHAVRIAIVDGILPIEVRVGSIELSQRSLEILEMISYGMTNDQIAERLESNPITSVREFQKIKNTLGANTRPHAVRRAFEEAIFSMTNQQLTLHQS